MNNIMVGIIGCSLLLVGVAMSAQRVDVHAKRETLLTACIRHNNYRFDARSYCKDIIGHCAGLDTDQGCFLRLASQTFAHETKSPNP